MDHDIVIVGGSFAGLAAALQLARARRSVLVVDAGLPRNRFSHASHGILGHDGRSPAEIRGLGRQQLLAYPTATVIDTTVDRVGGQADGFAVALGDGRSVEARRIILAHGVTDTLPDIEGLADCWGISVLHCPFCDGYEHADRRIGVLINDVMPTHQAMMLRDWSDDVTLFSEGCDLSAEERATLARRGVKVIEAPVAAVRHRDGYVQSVELAGGGETPLDALFVAPKTAPSSPLAAELGCELEDGPMGPYIKVDPRMATTVTGVCAAGDTARAMQNGSLAIADGVMAGAMTYMSLIPT